MHQLFGRNCILLAYIAKQFTISCFSEMCCTGNVQSGIMSVVIMRKNPFNSILRQIHIGYNKNSFALCNTPVVDLFHLSIWRRNNKFQILLHGNNSIHVALYFVIFKTAINIGQTNFSTGAITPSCFFGINSFFGKILYVNSKFPRNLYSKYQKHILRFGNISLQQSIENVKRNICVVFNLMF